MTPSRHREQATRRIQLPKSSTRAAAKYAHCKVIREVSQKPMGACFEGDVYPAGQVVDRSELPDPLVVLECVGPVGSARGHKRAPIVWVLWQWIEGDWRELARTAAINWEWALDLRAPALRALYPDPGLVDVLRVSREIAEGILEGIDLRLEREREEMRRSTFAALYDRMAARLTI